MSLFSSEKDRTTPADPGDQPVKQDRYREIVTMYKKTLLLDPEIAYNNEGHALVKLGQYQEALHVLDKALAIDPHYADAWINKGNALNQLDRYQEAVQALDAALAIAGDGATPWDKKRHALKLLMKLGRYQEALNALDTALVPDLHTKKIQELAGINAEGIKKIKKICTVENLNDEKL